MAVTSLTAAKAVRGQEREIVYVYLLLGGDDDHPVFAFLPIGFDRLLVLQYGDRSDVGGIQIVKRGHLLAVYHYQRFDIAFSGR